jgi:HK97 family phage portal protein
MGISTIQYASETLSLSYNTEHSAGNVFKNGGKLSGIYTISSYLDDDKRKEIEENWRKTFTNPDSTGIVIMEQGDTFNPITINNKEMMMLESRQFNVIDISRFMNISPILLYDYTKMSYSGLEEIMLEFLTTTIQPILTKIEKELNYKLITESQRFTKHIKFDTTGFIKTGKVTTADFYSKLFNTGVLSTNEIRNELGYKDIEGGNTNYIQVNLMKVGESALNTKIGDAVIDNKLKTTTS